MKKERPPLRKTEIITLGNETVTIEVSTQGAFLKSLLIENEEIIFTPREENPGRGGIPILGPTPGPITKEGWQTLYPKMPSHGTDRALHWNLEKNEKNKVTLTRQIGPKEFLFAGKIAVEIEVLNAGVIISKKITNYEDKPREIGHAFHPYFAKDQHTTFEPSALSDLQPLENGVPIIIKPGISMVQIRKGDNIYAVTANPQPIQTVVWTDNNEKYECIEPWWAEIGTGIFIGPRETKVFTMSILKE